MKTLKVPINPARFAHAVSTRAARTAVRTHTSAVKTLPTAGALQKFFTTAKKG